MEASKIQVLSGHYSPKSAYVVDDYPYGFRLRCKIRYWLEVNAKGTRFWSQTTNPKKIEEYWNTPKASTYCIVGAMFLNDEGHVTWTGLGVYDGNKSQAFLDTYGDGMTEGEKARCKNLADLYAGHAARMAAANNLSPTV
jgi:hypothetical protein